MSFESYLNLANAGFMFFTAVVPSYLAMRATNQSNLRVHSALFALFALLHGLYHLAVAVGNEFLGDVVLEPLSYGALLAFAISFTKRGVKFENGTPRSSS